MGATPQRPAASTLTLKGLNQKFGAALGGIEEKLRQSNDRLDEIDSIKESLEQMTSTLDQAFSKISDRLTDIEDVPREDAVSATDQVRQIMNEVLDPEMLEAGTKVVVGSLSEAFAKALKDKEVSAHFADAVQQYAAARNAGEAAASNVFATTWESGLGGKVVLVMAGVGAATVGCLVIEGVCQLFGVGGPLTAAASLLK